jgi:hypothetical protein
MGDGRADEDYVFHPGQPDIGDILASSAQEAIILLAEQRRANALFSHVRPPPGIGSAGGGR